MSKIIFPLIASLFSCFILSCEQQPKGNTTYELNNITLELPNRYDICIIDSIKHEYILKKDEKTILFLHSINGLTNMNNIEDDSKVELIDSSNNIYRFTKSDNPSNYSMLLGRKIKPIIQEERRITIPDCSKYDTTDVFSYNEYLECKMNESFAIEHNKERFKELNFEYIFTASTEHRFCSNLEDNLDIDTLKNYLNNIVIK